jgi:subtilase family serine protease
MLAGGVGLAASAAPAAASEHTAPAVSYKRACSVVNNPRIASCMALIRTDVKPHSAAYFRFGPPVGEGYGPSSLQSAYNLPSTTAGAGESVAVVDAYNDPDAVSNLASYRTAWGEAACNTTTEAGCLTVVNEQGAASPLPSNSGSTGWSVEESLDVDMVSAICPLCHIYLVEASTTAISDLGTGVNSAVSVLHVDFVSNSYGATDSSSDSTYDTDYYNHPGVAVTASAGDDGYGVSYPAASNDVLAVGGTKLVKASNTRGWTETVWGSSSGGEGTGSGCSLYEAKPVWQHGTFDSGCSMRTDNDVAADAAPGTGVAVYDSYDYPSHPWIEVGGTSEASPIIASVFALAGTPAAGTYPASYIYMHKTDLNDITKGSDGGPCTPGYLCKARKGYDGPTGWGTPNGTAAFTS